MANHKSAEKRIRQTAKRRLHNRYYAKTTRNAMRALRNTTDKAAAEAMLPKVSSMLDKLAKTNIIHANKASNLKSGLAMHIIKCNNAKSRRRDYRKSFKENSSQEWVLFFMPQVAINRIKPLSFKANFSRRKHIASVWHIFCYFATSN